jgi:hypothetical protein
MALALASASCLVTESPDFQPVGRGRPQLLPSELLPTTEVIKKTMGEPIPAFPVKYISEDAGERLQFTLLVDYGTPPGNAPNQPYRYSQWTRPAERACTATEVCTAELPAWTGDSNDAPGCHTLTLVATHAFFGFSPYERCPKSADDADTLTWVVFLCEAPSSCPDLANGCLADDTPGVYCPPNPQ